MDDGTSSAISDVLLQPSVASVVIFDNDGNNDIRPFHFLSKGSHFSTEMSPFNIAVIFCILSLSRVSKCQIEYVQGVILKTLASSSVGSVQLIDGMAHYFYCLSV